MEIPRCCIFGLQDGVIVVGCHFLDMNILTAVSLNTLDLLTYPQNHGSLNNTPNGWNLKLRDHAFNVAMIRHVASLDQYMNAPSLQRLDGILGSCMRHSTSAGKDQVSRSMIGHPKCHRTANASESPDQHIRRIRSKEVARSFGESGLTIR